MQQGPYRLYHYYPLDDRQVDPGYCSGRQDRRGAHAGLHERRGPGQDQRDGQGPLLVPLAKEALAEGRVLRAFQRVLEIRIDCDEDAVLLLIEQEGGACHTGYRSCFYRTLDGIIVGEKVFDPEDVY